MKKEVKKIVAVGMIVIFAIGAAFVLLPKDNSNPPVAAEPTTPVNPTPKPAEPIPSNPKLDPAKPALVSFSKSGTAESEIEATSATIICKVPEGTQVILDVKAVLLERAWYRADKPQEEHCLIALVDDSYGFFFLGINPTKELADQLGKTHSSDSNKQTVEVPAGTILGTVGRPLKNDWGTERYNLVIIVATDSENTHIIKPSVAAILESLR